MESPQLEVFFLSMLLDRRVSLVLSDSSSEGMVTVSSLASTRFWGSLSWVSSKLEG